MDSEDGGYTYASNVDNHRSLMADMCDIKAHANAGEWTAAKGIYTNGKNSAKSGGRLRSLKGFSSANANPGSEKMRAQPYFQSFKGACARGGRPEFCLCAHAQGSGRPAAARAEEVARRRRVEAGGHIGVDEDVDLSTREGVDDHPAAPL